jgi:hypothetical protein
MACEGITIETTTLDEVIEVGVVGPQGPSGAAGVGVPTGGITGYVLAKKTSADYDTEWIFNSGGGGDLSNPPPIGDVTPNTGQFTFLQATNAISASNITLYDGAGGGNGVTIDGGGIVFNDTTVQTTAFNIDFASPPSIGLTTPNTGAFTTLTANNGTLTASAPVLDLAQTWNASGTAFTALTLELTNTASASASSYFNINLDDVEAFSIRRGESSASATLIRCGGSGFRWTARTRTGGGVGLNFEHSLGIGSSLEFLATASGTTGGDVVLLRDEASDTLAQRRSTNAQTFRIYNTFTSTTNHERGFLRWSSNVFQIGTEKGSGGGTARALDLQTDGVTRITIAADGSNVSFNPQVSFNQNVTIVGGRVLGVNQINLSTTSTSTLVLGTDSVIRWSSTSSFPSLRRSGTTLRVRLADDSADAPLSCSALTLSDNLTFGSGNNIVLSTTTGTKIGTATNQLLGFYGTTAIAQPSSTGLGTTGFVGGGGGNTVHADSTFTGGVGTTAYNISDIVKHLKNLGLIAS